MLAQKFVDQTKADAKGQAEQTISEAEARARTMTEEAQAQASHIAAEAEQRLRDEINRLETSRSKLTHEVESMSRHLEGERNRLRAALGDILRWVDENVQPSRATADVPSGGEPAGSDENSTEPAPSPAPAAQAGNRPSVAAQGAPAQRSSGTGPSGEVTQMRPAGVTTRPANTNSPLPL